MVKLTPRRRWRGPALGGRLIWFDYHALVSKRMELAVTCEATLLRHFRPLVDRRQSQFRSARQHGLPIEEEQRRCQDVESLNARNTRFVHGRCDLFRGGCGKDQKLHVTRARPLFQTLQVLGSGDVGIGGDPANARSGDGQAACVGESDQLHHFIAAGVWDAAPVETELLVQADRFCAI